jgi:hypothetical protein
METMIIYGLTARLLRMARRAVADGHGRFSSGRAGRRWFIAIHPSQVVRSCFSLGRRVVR